MSTHPRIRALLDDLYAIDPSLRTHEHELLPLIEQLLQSDPGREPDAAFVSELRAQLLHKAAAMSSVSPSSSSSFFSVMHKFLYAGIGAVTVAVIAIPAVYYGVRPSPNPSGTSLFSYRISTTSPRAFGDLTTLNVNDSARPQSGGGGGGLGGGGMNAIAPEASAVTEGQDAKMIAPEYYGDIVQYSYSYSGALPELPQDTVSVLRRERGSNRPGLSALLSTFSLGNINLSSFAGALLDSVTFSQDREYGYMISVMLKEGTVNMNQNWEKWPHPEQQCRDEACYQRYRVQIGDLPADADLLRIAAAFASEHSIDLSQYGEPEVENTWRIDYERTPNKTDAYVPEMLQVLYPLLLDGRPVYDQGGSKAGIHISISVRHKRVSDVWGIQSQSYTRSAYEAISGSGTISSYLDQFEKIDPRFYPQNVTIKNVAVTLGEPTLGYATYYAYEKIPAEELVVPALIFPVTGTSDTQYPTWRQSVVVPLAKELLEQNSPQAFPVDGPMLR